MTRYLEQPDLVIDSPIRKVEGDGAGGQVLRHPQPCESSCHRIGRPDPGIRSEKHREVMSVRWKGSTLLLFDNILHQRFASNRVDNKDACAKQIGGTLSNDAQTCRPLVATSSAANARASPLNRRHTREKPKVPSQRRSPSARTNAATDRNGTDHARSEKPMRGFRSCLGIGTVARVMTPSLACRFTTT
ncbi:hypothetical protein H845_778 [Komagataeibacter xylinus E25]|nr:hypothetical protein H845_778 [Komagataeibacter xylinus E25]